MRYTGTLTSRDAGNYGLVAMTALGGVLLIGFQNRPAGWALLATAGLLAFVWKTATVRKHLLLVLFSLAILGLTPINTDISPGHIAFMGFMLTLTVLVPYLVSRFVYREDIISFPLRTGQGWPKALSLYIAATAAIAYLLLPYYLISTGSYHNWDVEPGFGFLALLFLGTNGLGIWDELFFVTTVLALFRRHVPFWFANVAQAALWTAFLYELGFRGWGPWFLFPFALSQGFIFRKTKSLLYILAIHLTLDFVLYLALIHAHQPDWLPIFLLSPHN